MSANPHYAMNESINVPSSQPGPANSGLQLMNVMYPPPPPPPPPAAATAPQGPLPPPPASASPDEVDEAPTNVLPPSQPLPPSPRPSSAGAAAYLALEAGSVGYSGSGRRILTAECLHTSSYGLSGNPPHPPPPQQPRAATPMHTGINRSKRHAINLHKQHSVGCAQECFDQTFRPNFDS